MKRLIWLASLLFLIVLLAPPVQANDDQGWARLRAIERATEQALNDYFLDLSRQRAERWRQQWAQRTPIPDASPRPLFQATAVAATATAWRTWRATMVAETEAWVARTHPTLQAYHRATMAASPTRTPRPAATPTPAATPMPLYWDVTVLEVVAHYEQLAAAAGYLAHYPSGLVAGEQWLIVKLRVTNRRSRSAQPRSVGSSIIGGTGRQTMFTAIGCPLPWHPLDAARFAAETPGIEREFIAARYPLLAPYHQLSWERIGPGASAEGWQCFVVQNEDVPGARLAMRHPDGQYLTTWRLDDPTPITHRR